LIRAITTIFISILLLGCNAYKPIIVRLQPTDGPEQQIGVANYFLKDIEPDSAQTAFAKKLNFDPFVFSLFDYNPKQIDTKPVDTHTSKTLFLTGLRNDSVFVVADANTNNRLDDDKIIPINKKILESQSTKNLKEFPIVRIYNLKAVYNGQPYTFSRKFFLMPNTITTGNLTLKLISNEYLKGRFRYKGKRNYVYARQISSGHFITEPEWSNIRIDENKNIPNEKYRGSEIYHLYDTVKKGKNIFVIQNVSPFLDTVVLKPILSNSLISRKAEVSQTTYEDINQATEKLYPHLKYLSDTLLVGGVKNKVLFLNFWFTNCLPCIAEFNTLNNLYNQYKTDSSFKLISLTFESPEEIQRMREKYSLLFDIILFRKKK
jgi:thiol-disulfide isomerase/thioredoxin